MRRLRIVALTSIFLLIASSAWPQDLQSYLDQGVKRYAISDFQGALDAWQKGLELARRLDHTQAIGAFLGNIGVVYFDLADYPKALASYEQALRIARDDKSRAQFRKPGVVYLWISFSSVSRPSDKSPGHAPGSSFILRPSGLPLRISRALGDHW